MLLCSAPKQVAFSHGVASSTSIGTYGGLQERTDEITNDKGLKGSASGDDQDLLSSPSATITADENDEDPLFKKKKREYKEPWVIIGLVHLFLLLFHMSLRLPPNFTGFLNAIPGL